MINNYFFKICVLCTVVNSVYFSTRASIDVAEEMKKAHIVPDVIPIAPTEPLNVTFDNTYEVNFGNELTAAQIKYEPKLKWKAELNAYYTLYFINADAPSEPMPEYKEWLHWLVVNIPEDNVCDGEELAEYINPQPKPLLGLQRFIFLIFKQECKRIFDEPYIENEFEYLRLSTYYAIDKFTERYNLSNPVAGNYFKAQYIDEQKNTSQKINK